eukprot:193295-Alexandrium_andersonii.AAC.1
MELPPWQFHRSNACLSPEWPLPLALGDRSAAVRAHLPPGRPLPLAPANPSAALCVHLPPRATLCSARRATPPS